MVAGASAILIGVGPGHACTTRGVLGLGVPQITATADCAAARDDFFRDTGKYVPVITDGGMRTGAHICKSLVAGADAVMIGSPMAGSTEAPGGGWHWGMATPHADLPRGTRVKVGRQASLRQLLRGPATRDDGTQNFVGAIRTLMGNVGALTIQELQLAEMALAPSIVSEGKFLQRSQGVGMGA
jgi:IMP dehydrogenase